MIAVQVTWRLESVFSIYFIKSKDVLFLDKANQTPIKLFVTAAWNMLFVAVYKAFLRL